jgi:hypothetical protein
MASGGGRLRGSGEPVDPDILVRIARFQQYNSALWYMISEFYKNSQGSTFFNSVSLG